MNAAGSWWVARHDERGLFQIPHLIQADFATLWEPVSEKHIAGAAV